MRGSITQKIRLVLQKTHCNSRFATTVYVPLRCVRVWEGEMDGRIVERDFGRLNKAPEPSSCSSTVKLAPLQLTYAATRHVFDLIAGLGRTEDVKFSPNNRRLAIVSFLRNKIAVFELCISACSSGTKITITDGAEFSSAYLKQPQGIDFIDDEKIIVANREGHAPIFSLPPGRGDRSGGDELVPLNIVRSGDVMNNPGAVAITRKASKLHEVLICNNYTNKITKHLIDFNKDPSMIIDEILLEKWLELPDGITTSDRWIAISNHDRHNVLLYDASYPLNIHSDPNGILRGAYYPHGLRFTSDGRFILVADAGAPYVHIYGKDDSGWKGVRSPLKSIRVLTDEDYLLGRHTVHEGGPKGIDIDSSMSTFVTTCEAQPLAFFDFPTVLRSIPERNEDDAQRSLEIRYELAFQDQLKQEVERAVTLMKNSLSWRITSPLRSLRSFQRNYRNRDGSL